ncbi:hypothetical protein E4U49_007266 [Claviceps purpurea]|nr:hypothetical protein E4U49_007266 [Claviceps purpurea]
MRKNEPQGNDDLCPYHILPHPTFLLFLCLSSVAIIFGGSNSCNMNRYRAPFGHK